MPAPVTAPIGLELDGVTVEFPVYGVNGRSLRNDLLRKGTGGLIGRDEGRRVVVRALEEVTLSFAHGDRVGLVGANGAGKSTLLRTMAGVYRPSRGEVRRWGRLASLIDLSLGMEADSTGWENIMTRGRFFGLSKLEMERHMEEIAEFTELGGYLSMPIGTYSDGMKLRLALAVSTCFQPEILLMDEWISVSDAAFADKARKRVEEFVDRAGILAIASHNPGLLERVCEKGVLLRAGRVEASGGIGEVLRQYRGAGK